MNIKIILFGPLSEVVGNTHLILEGVTDTDVLIQRMITDFPLLKNYEYKLAVGKQLIINNTILNSGDEVAFLPAFAGG